MIVVYKPAVCLAAVICLSGLLAAQVQNSPAPNPADRQPASPVTSGVIERIDFSGTSSVSEDTLRATVLSKAGDMYSEDAIHRGFIALWNTSRFDDIRVDSAKGDRGGVVVRFVLTERPQQALPALAPNVIEGIEFSGLRRVSEETMRSAMLSKVGDAYDENVMKRSFTALWSTGRFDDVRLKTVKGARGGVIVRFVVTERP